MYMSKRRKMSKQSRQHPCRMLMSLLHYRMHMIPQWLALPGAYILGGHDIVPRSVCISGWVPQPKQRQPLDLTLSSRTGGRAAVGLGAAAGEAACGGICT
jgi:hypothetical protein